MENKKIKKLSEELNSLLEKIEQSFNSGDVNEAGRKIIPFFETILYPLTTAAGIEVGRIGDFQKKAIEDLYEAKWITDDENSKLHKLRVIRSAFEYQDKTDINGTPEKKEELKKYRTTFGTVIKWCRCDITMFENIMERISSGTHVENSAESSYASEEYSASGNSNSYEDKAGAILEKIKISYSDGEIKETGEYIDQFFLNVLTTMVTLAGIEDSNDKIALIDSLYSEKWINTSEKDILHDLREERSFFAHQRKIEYSSDPKEKAELKQHRDNLPETIALCAVVFDIFKQRIRTIGAGCRVSNDNNRSHVNDNNNRSYSNNNYSNSGLNENNNRHYSNNTHYNNSNSNTGTIFYERTWVNRTYSRENKTHSPSHSSTGNIWDYAPDIVKTLMPFVSFILAAVLAIAVGVLFDLKSFADVAEKHAIDLSFFEESKSIVVIFILTLACAVLFFQITAQIACGATIFVLSHQATDSLPCAVLLTLMMVLMVTRFNDKFRHILSYIFYGLCLLISVFSAPDYLKERLGPDAVLDTHTKLVKIALPIVIYVFVVLVFVVSNSKRKGFWELFYDVFENPLFSTVPIVIIGGIVAFVYRSTWKNGLILLTSHFYETPVLFWTIHIVLAALVAYCISIVYDK